MTLRPIPASLPLMSKLSPQCCHLLLDHFCTPGAAHTLLAGIDFVQPLQQQLQLFFYWQVFLVLQQDQTLLLYCQGELGGERSGSEQPIGPLGRQEETHSSQWLLLGTAVKQQH